MVAILAALRLLSFVDSYSSDVLFMDQWDFLTPLFRGEGLLASFRLQHGPHRQGLGGVLQALLYPATGWSSRAEVVVAVGCAAAATLLVVLAVGRTSGGPHLADCAAPLLLLAPTAAETYASTPNLAHGPLPLLLAAGAAFSLTARSPVTRALALGLIGAVSTHTGFAFFLGIPLLVLLVVEVVRCASEGARAPAATAALAFSAVVASFAWFADGYRFMPAVDCFRFPDPRWWMYAPYAGAQLLRPFATVQGLFQGSLALVPAAVYLGAVTFAAVSLRGSLRPVRDRGSEIQFLLSSFSVLFAANVAVGRLCLGLSTPTRYVPYALPLLIALLFALRGSRSRWAGAGASALAVVSAVALLAQAAGTASEWRYYQKWKNGWKACYLARHDLATCDRETSPLHPDAARTGLQQKLEFLEARRLNLFR